MEKETQIMFCDKDEFPTSALNLHLKLHVVYLILLERTNQETVCSFLLLVTQIQSVKTNHLWYRKKKTSLFYCTSVDKFKASKGTDFAWYKACSASFRNVLLKLLVQSSIS